VGPEAARLFLAHRLTVLGIDNDLRGRFFGPEASSHWQVAELQNRPRHGHEPADIRDAEAIRAIFRRPAAGCRASTGAPRTVEALLALCGRG